MVGGLKVRIRRHRTGLFKKFLKHHADVADLPLNGGNTRGPRFQRNPILPVGNQAGSIEMQPPDMECACLGPRIQQATLARNDMGSDILVQRMKNPVQSRRIPVVAFKFIAGVTGVDEVPEVVRAAVRYRLKMILRQFGADIALTYSAIRASKSKYLAQTLPISLSENGH